MIDNRLAVRPAFNTLDPAASTGFRVEEADMGGIMSILSDNIYSDKIMAVVREIICNAVDACVMSPNIGKPVVLHAPTIAEPWISFRDWGNGLSFEEVKNIFVCYGKSTKRDTNLATGMLGIGSKSPFSYTDAFNVISYTGTEKVTYCAQKTANGGATMYQVATIPCDEPTGLEVVVYVESHDIDAFHQRIRSFYRYCQYPITCDQIKLAKVDIEYLSEDDKSFFVATSKNRYDQTEKDSCGVVMGNIRYPLTISRYTCENGVALESDVFNFAQRTQFVVPMGSVMFTASREAIKYTKDTISNLTNFINSAYKSAVAEIQKRISAAKTIFDLGDVNRACDNFGLKFDQCEWKGVRLSDISGFLRTNSREIHLKNDRFSTKSHGIACTSLTTKDVIVLIDEHEHMEKQVSRRAYSLKRDGRVLIIRAENSKLIQRMGKPDEKVFTLDDLAIPYAKLSSVPLFKIERKASDGDVYSGFRRGIYGISREYRGYHRDRLSVKREAIPEGKKYYIQTDVSSGGSRTLFSDKLFDFLSSKTGILYTQVFAATPSAVTSISKLGDWEELNLENRIKELVSKEYSKEDFTNIVALSRFSSLKDFAPDIESKRSKYTSVPPYIRELANSEYDESVIEAIEHRRDTINAIEYLCTQAFGEGQTLDVKKRFTQAILPVVEKFIADEKVKP